MIDPSFVDITDEELAQGNPFIAPYPPTVRELEEKIANLEASLGQKNTNWEFASAQLQKRVAQIESFEGALKNNEWDFDFDTLADLASYFDIALEKEYDVTITVRWSGTVSAPMDYDMDDIENILDISLDTGYGGAALTVDVYQDEFDIDYNEVM